MLSAVEQLGGLELPAGDWESRILAPRVVGYEPRWLDELCLSGELAWGRLTPRLERDPDGDRRGASSPSPATPLALMAREDLAWLLQAVRIGEAAPEPTAGSAADVLAVLRTKGASFRAELGPLARRLPAEVDDGLWDLVARGIVTADAFSAVRALLSAGARWNSRQRHRPRRPGRALRRAAVGSGVGEGRWALLPDLAGPTEAREVEDELAEAVAWRMLERWGVVCFELYSRESFRLPWRVVARALRRLEARGLALGGRFVAGVTGEQYALPEAADELASVRGRPDGQLLEVAGSDPLNLTGILLPGPRVPAIRHRSVLLRDGSVVEGREPVARSQTAS